MASSTRFPNLTVPVICTTDPAQIAAQIITEYEADFLAVQQIAKNLAPGDPVRLILLRMAARESQYRSLLNFTFQQNFIISAIGNNLDAIGSNYGSGNTLGTNLSGERLAASAAVTTLQFSLSVAINVDVPIPQGTIVASGPAQFATLAAATITAGTASVSVAAQCTQTGIIGNGYTVGQISQITNYGLPFVITASNTTATQGGSAAESDDAYAQRLALLPGAFSCAGPAGAYKYWARTASSAIIDVSILTPDTTPSVAAGNINVIPLLGPAGSGSANQIPGSTFLAQVAQIFNNDIRPLGDVVTVIAPTATTYNVTGTYYIDPANVVLQPTIDANVQAAVTTFINYTASRIGRDIDPSYLTFLVIQAGASDLVLTAPTRTVLDSAHIGIQSGTIAMTYGGPQL